MSHNEEMSLDDVVAYELEMDLAEKFPVDLSDYDSFEASILSAEDNENSWGASVFIPQYNGSKWNVEFVSKFQKKFKKFEQRVKNEIYDAVSEIVKDPTGEKCSSIHPLTGPLKCHWEFNLSQKFRLIYKFESSNNRICLKGGGYSEKYSDILN